MKHDMLENGMQRDDRAAHDCLGPCNCALVVTGTEESFREVEFTRSACAAAQSGNVTKLARLLDRFPDQVHQDGTGIPQITVAIALKIS
jgi:hypothetical protein